jgi:hypothetical protein
MGQHQSPCAPDDEPPRPPRRLWDPVLRLTYESLTVCRDVIGRFSKRPRKAPPSQLVLPYGADEEAA